VGQVLSGLQPLQPPGSLHQLRVKAPEAGAPLAGTAEPRSGERQAYETWHVTLLLWSSGTTAFRLILTNHPETRCCSTLSIHGHWLRAGRLQEKPNILENHLPGTDMIPKWDITCLGPPVSKKLGYADTLTRYKKIYF